MGFPQIQRKRESPCLGFKPVFKPPARSMEHSSFHDHKHDAHRLVGLILNMSVCSWNGKIIWLVSVCSLCSPIIAFTLQCVGTPQERWNVIRPQHCTRGCECGGTLACVCFIHLKANQGSCNEQYIPHSISPSVWFECENDFYKVH